jgi:hypothetical protein
MQLTRPRPTALTLTLTRQELAALFAAARLAVDALRADEQAPQEAVEALERIIDDYERALRRLNDDGRP